MFTRRKLMSLFAVLPMLPFGQHRRRDKAGIYIADDGSVFMHNIRGREVRPGESPGIIVHADHIECVGTKVHHAITVL